jgi:hypothetical protein
MTNRYSSKHIEAWRQEGAVVVPEFFKEEEIREIVTDFEEVFPGRKAEAEALNKKQNCDSAQCNMLHVCQLCFKDHPALDCKR